MTMMAEGMPYQTIVAAATAAAGRGKESHRARHRPFAIQPRGTLAQQLEAEWQTI
jgi:hypothetical protein